MAFTQSFLFIAVELHQRMWQQDLLLYTLQYYLIQVVFIHRHSQVEQNLENLTAEFYIFVADGHGVLLHILQAQIQDLNEICETMQVLADLGSGNEKANIGDDLLGNFIHCARCGLDKNIVSTTVPERAVLSVLSIGVALRTDQSAASKVAETCIFLASIWLVFVRHVVLFWLWLPRHGRWTAPVDSEIQRNMCEMLGISALKGYQVEALEAVCLNKCDMLVCVPTGSRNSACFKAGLISTVIDHVIVSERAA